MFSPLARWTKASCFAMTNPELAGGGEPVKPRGAWIWSDGRTHPKTDDPRYFVARRGAEFVTIPWSKLSSDLKLPTYLAETPLEERLFREKLGP